MNDTRAATVFTGLAVIIIILCIIAFVLFFMCRQAPINAFQNICMIRKKYIYNAKRHFSLQNYKSQLPRRSSDVFKICGAMQLLSGLCLAIGKIGVQYILNFNTIIPKQSRILSLFQVFILSGILSFPAGWDNDEVRAICGEEVGS